MNQEEEHVVDWNITKEYCEDMLKSTGDIKYEYRIQACDRLLETIK